MPSGSRVLGFECLRCRALFDDPRLFSGCPRCHAQGIPVNLTVKLDLTLLIEITPEKLPSVPWSLWRYRELLPVGGEHPVWLSALGCKLAISNDSRALRQEGDPAATASPLIRGAAQMADTGLRNALAEFPRRLEGVINGGSVR